MKNATIEPNDRGEWVIKCNGRTWVYRHEDDARAAFAAMDMPGLAEGDSLEAAGTRGLPIRRLQEGK